MGITPLISFIPEAFLEDLLGVRHALGIGDPAVSSHRNSRPQELMALVGVTDSKQGFKSR